MTTGAICSSVFKKNDLYLFFESHSHRKNGLFSCDGGSIVIAFSCLDDLIITYLYAFYDSLRRDNIMSLQFDFLPVIVRKCEQEKSHKGQLENHFEAYFEDQKKQQVKKAHNIVSDIGIVKETTRVKKRKKRTEYNKLYKKRQRQDTALKQTRLIKRRHICRIKEKTLLLKQTRLIQIRHICRIKEKTLLLKATRLIKSRHICRIKERLCL